MQPRRKPSIDALRGLVMVLMVLDHAREYFSPTPFDPTDADLTTPTWFAMRWVTHFCAPVFVFLAGTAAWFKGTKVGDPELSRWLVIRGLWLILIEVVLNNVLWFSSAWPTLGFFVQIQVLWAIGISMIVLGGLCRLPRAFVAAFACAMIAGHNLLDGIEPAPVGDQGALDILWAMLHHKTLVPFAQYAPLAEIAPRGLLLVNYPAVPWIGVLAAGWVFGSWFETLEHRGPRLTALGTGLCVGFILLRATNAYGDPDPWTPSPRGGLHTLFDFLDCEKYPPSLCFLLMTLGPALLVLALFEQLPERRLRWLVVYGRVPFFFYLAHIAVIHAAAITLTLIQGRTLGWWWVASSGPVEGYEPSATVSLAVWSLAVVALYRPCRAWGRLKATNPSRWIGLF